VLKNLVQFKKMDSDDSITAMWAASGRSDFLFLHLCQLTSQLRKNI
jgi:hypothetical protein